MMAHRGPRAAGGGPWIPGTCQLFLQPEVSRSVLPQSEWCLEAPTRLGPLRGMDVVQTEAAGQEATVVPGLVEEVCRVPRREGSGDCCVCAFAEIQSKRQERKRRSTANPAYSGLLETEVSPAALPGEGRLPGAGRPHLTSWDGSSGVTITSHSPRAEFRINRDTVQDIQMSVVLLTRAAWACGSAAGHSDLLTLRPVIRHGAQPQVVGSDTLELPPLLEAVS